MNEMTPPKDHYERLSPFERNVQLRGLYQQLPLVTDSPSETTSGIEKLTIEQLKQGIQGTIGRMLRRGGSDHKRKFFENLDTLISYAHITDTFRQHIRWYFDLFYTLGADRDQVNSYADEEFHLILDRSNPESAGIFEPRRAQEIERETFQYVRRTMHTRGIFDKARITDWRLDYWKTHDIDPRKR